MNFQHITLPLTFLVLGFGFSIGSFSFIHGKAAWIDANKECRERYNGSVVDITKENHDVVNTQNWLFWTGRYKILSPWIQLYGCVELLKEYPHHIENVSREKCLQYCLEEKFHFFAFQTETFFQQNSSCICLRSNFKDLYFRDTSAFNCRKPGYTTNRNILYLYNVLQETEEPNQTGSQRCLLLNCGRNTDSYETANCSELHKAICANGNIPPDVRTWSMSKEFCYSNGSSLALKADSRTNSGCNFIKSNFLENGKYWIGAFRMKQEMEYTGQYPERPVIGCEVVGRYMSSHVFHTWKRECYQSKLQYCCKTGTYARHPYTTPHSFETGTPSLSKFFSSATKKAQFDSTIMVTTTQKENVVSKEKQEHNTQNLNKGVVAGIAVACVVFVGIISFIMAYLLCKRQRNIPKSKERSPFSSQDENSIYMETMTNLPTQNKKQVSNAVYFATGNNEIKMTQSAGNNIDVASKIKPEHRNDLARNAQLSSKQGNGHIYTNDLVLNSDANPYEIIEQSTVASRRLSRKTEKGKATPEPDDGYTLAKLCHPTESITKAHVYSNEVFSDSVGIYHGPSVNDAETYSLGKNTNGNVHMVENNAREICNDYSLAQPFPVVTGTDVSGEYQNHSCERTDENHSHVQLDVDSVYVEDNTNQYDCLNNKRDKLHDILKSENVYNHAQVNDVDDDLEYDTTKQYGDNAFGDDEYSHTIGNEEIQYNYLIKEDGLVGDTRESRGIYDQVY